MHTLQMVELQRSSPQLWAVVGCLEACLCLQREAMKKAKVKCVVESFKRSVFFHLVSKSPPRTSSAIGV